MKKNICIGLAFAAALAWAAPSAAEKINDGIDKETAFENALAAYKAGDTEASVRWSRIAAEKGHAPSQHALATMFATGQGVGLDYAKALKWWRQAAGQGDVHSIYNLGVMYSHGRGVPVDYVEAYKWLHLATEMGFQDAYQLQPRLAETMSLGEIAISQAKARAWAARHGLH